MAEDSQRSWWTTMPGIMTGIAGIITALTGLLVATSQLGLFDSDDAAGSNGVANPAAVSGQDPGGTVATHTAPTPAGATPAAGGEHYAVDMPLNEKFTSGEVTYSVLEAEAVPATDGQLTVSFLIRAATGDGGINFWDDTFRVQIGDDIYSPTSGLNEVVNAQSTKKGTVTFVVPEDTTSAIFRIRFYEGDRNVPFTITAGP